MQLNCFVIKMLHYLKDIYRLPSTMCTVSHLYITVSLLPTTAPLPPALFQYRITFVFVHLCEGKWECC